MNNGFDLYFHNPKQFSRGALCWTLDFFAPKALKSYFICKRYLELRYQAEILTQASYRGRQGMFFIFRYQHPGPFHGCQEGHPHEGHHEDKLNIIQVHVLYFVFQDKLILTSYMSIRVNQVTLRDFKRRSFFVKSVWVLRRRFIHHKPLRKTCFYDNCDRKSVIPQKRFQFLEFKLDLCPKCGHCETF